MSKNIAETIPIGHLQMRDNILSKDSILGLTQDKNEWAKSLNLSEEGEYTLFAGCGYQLMKYAEGMMSAAHSAEKLGLGMDKSIGISKAFGKMELDLAGIAGKAMTLGKKDAYTIALTSTVSVLRKLGVQVGYLHGKEPCCGSPLYYSGFVDDYIDKSRKNYALLKSMGVRRLIGVVPACTASLQNIYPRFIDGFDIEVRYYIQIVADRLKETSVSPRLKEPLSIAYHDPCQLSRYLSLSNLVREIMSKIEGLEIREPEAELRGEWSTCCGGGGGLEIFAPELAERLAVNRVKELSATGASVIVTNTNVIIVVE